MERRFEERKRAMLAECEVPAELFEGMLSRLKAFMSPFTSKLTTYEQRFGAVDYVAGLCAPLERKTSETIAYFQSQERHVLQRFIGWSRWDHQPLLDELARQVGESIGEADGILVIDPSAFAKKGAESVGVQRQWNGRAGKIDNCQMGVYLGYVSRREQALVDVRLYLPEEWARDRRRRKKCHVPKTVKFATRLKLALSMIAAQAAKLPHAWVVGDDEFGRSTGFRRDLRAASERYLLAVPSNFLVRDLAAEPPAWRGFGKRPLAPFVRVDAWRARLAPQDWTRVEVRDGEKGPLVMDVAVTRVLAKTERTKPEAEETLLVTRRIEEDGRVIHDYWLSNAPPETTRQEFARVAKARGRIEQCIQRGKSETGLADYETRTWEGWHHHQTLSMMASWFLVQETLRGGKKGAGHHLPSTSRGFGHAVACGPRSAHRPPLGPSRPNPIGPQRNRPLLSLEEAQPLTAFAHQSTTID